MNTHNTENMNTFLVGVKAQLLNIWAFFSSSIDNNPTTSLFMGIFGALTQFFVKSIAVDVWLVFSLILLCVVNTFTGIKKAKRDGEYSDKVLGNSIKHKWTGYAVLLCALGIFMGMLFIVTNKEGKMLVSEYWLNLPIMLMLVFFNAMEFRSIIQNATDLGWNVPIFVKKMPDQIIDKVDEIGGNFKINKDQK